MNEVVDMAEVAPYNRPGNWFVINAKSGQENTVKKNLEARIRSMNMDDRIFEIAVPMHEVTEIRAGKKVVSNKKLFPGYILVRCRLDDDSWYVIRNTPGVTGFLGSGKKPMKLTRKEIETFMPGEDQQNIPVVDAKPVRNFEIGDLVRVRDGALADFSGHIIEINDEQEKVRVSVDIFGRETPVELDFTQIVKI
jgi:transcriptional antiterminator NusG